ncbi:hypothetical protein [Vibrio ziniensis]|uniref:Uncharacterized protein n=1 Tax=Vibrio ziniensis TaxID=2711221 RepID=A0A6G7CHF3_9VIBR|nr:hypothetical protein [Vibrio ziniensis]QIH41537.1 hypothetical protein G5S32_05835 [Vibrio ziniensis]
MFTIEGVCDWCKKPSLLLTKHEYVDGKTHSSCKSCNDFARMDVRQFNIAEQAMKERQQPHSL